MDEELYIKLVMRHVHVPDPNDHDMIVADARRKFQKGWAVVDTISYLRSCEEVSPELDEAVAIARMKSIAAKYPK